MLICGREMKTRASVIIWFCILVGFTPLALCEDGELCNRNFRTEVYTRDEILEDGSLQSAEDDALYPNGTFWTDEDETTWACPCLLGNCIRICSENLTRILESDLNITLDYGSSNSSITIWDGKNESAVAIDEEFKLVRDAWCQHAILLRPETDKWDAFRIFSNGSLYFTYCEVEDKHRIVKPDGFCIIPITDGQDSRAVLCADELSQPTISTKFKFYPVFFLISAFFLVLTLITFYYSPDLKNLHGRAMACQSASLLAVCLGMTLIYYTGATLEIKICVATTYINYYFSMATFFWLNVMCVDIFLTFKGSIAQKQDINFLYPLVYGWGGPALLTILVIAMDQTTQNDTFSPRIGLLRCWFQGFWSEFLYYIGPLVILLSLNLVFFGMTAVKLWRMSKESQKVFKGANSKVHAPAGQRQQDKDQFTLYAKLFLLMGVTWIMEVISWAIGGHESIWYFTDSLNYLRGVLIFWFCVWSKPNMRKVFLDKFACRRFRKQPALDMSSKDTSRTTTTSITSTTA